MKKKNYKNRWELCSFCKQIKLVSGSNHHCPDAVKIQREIEIEQIVDEEMLIFELSQAEFWDDPYTKFTQHLIDKGQL